MSKAITKHHMTLDLYFPCRKTTFSLLDNTIFHTGKHRFPYWKILGNFLLLMIISLAGATHAWGQTITDGLYYIASGGNDNTYDNILYDSNSPTTNYYLCPTENWRYFNSQSPFYQESPDNGMPFMTTYQCLKVENNYDSKKAVWCIKKKENTDYYYIIHVVDGKYLTRNVAIGHSCNVGRMRVHLESSPDDDDALFTITFAEDVTAYNCYDIKTKKNDGSSGDNANRQYLNASGGNQNTLQANNKKSDGPKVNGSGAKINVGGTIGLYINGSTSDQNSRWCPKSTLLTAPTISNVSATNTITITDANNLPDGYTIRYTTGDGTQDAPTATTGYLYSDPIDVTSSMTVKAVVVRYGIVLTNVASKSVSPGLVAPTVTNNYDGTISLSTNIASATIYYTTNGDTPDNNSTPYSSAFSLGNAMVIKAIAYLGSEHSEVTSYNVPQYDAPTISFNSATSLVTITSEGTAYYNTGDGSQADPTTSSTEYSAPFTVSSGTTIKAIATHAGYLASGVASLAIAQVATPTIQDNGSNAVSITCATAGATIYYTTDGSTPTTESTLYTGPLTENVSNVNIKAIAVKENMIPSAVGSGTVKLQCATPVITRDGMTFSISCSMPTGATLYYSLDGTTPATQYSGPVSFTSNQLPTTVTAVAKHTDYTDSESASFVLLNGTGDPSDPYLIYGATDFANFISNVNAGTTSSACYKLETDISASSASAITTAFTGTFDGNFHIISGLEHALFNSINGGKVKNVILQDVGISSGTNVGAICNEATGASRIYNCGILPTTVLRDDPNDKDKITGFSGSSVGGSDNVGGIVGLLSDNARVINCYSYANITGGNIVAGIVGNIGYAANGTITQDDVDTKPMVVNCMFYGDITGGSSIYPVYGGASGAMIKNDADNGVNPYCYYRKNASFDDSYNNIANYKRSWPAEEKNLTRFEYYRSILNGNRHLCTYWATDRAYSAQTAADTALVAKWVLDPTIAPYPILKKWGKYPSVINKDPEYRYNPQTKANELRSVAKEWEGKSLRTISVTVNAGSHHAGTGATSKTLTNVPVLDMDTLNCDYAYAKIQLPYYNELFGDPSVVIPAPSEDDYISKWNQRYGGNYKEYVVTGWDVSGGSSATNYNFADRNSYSGRVFAQGGYFYVPEGVSSISITAHWGKAVYLSNRGNSIDRVKVTYGTTYKTDQPFTPAGKISQKFGTSDNIFKPAGDACTIWGDLQDAIKALQEKSDTYPTVYDQAIVLVGNHQVKNGSSYVKSGKDYTDGNTDVSFLLDGKWHPFTFMSADFDIDDEPDFCLQLQFRQDIDRPGIQPIRFDFLPVIELGLAVRHDNLAYAIGIMVPQGHFEVTETALMRTTQFEYDGFKCPERTTERIEEKSPMILNGGEFEMFTVRYHDSNRTSYFLLGGNVWVHRFAPGAHPNTGNKPKIYLCPINVIGGQVKELYLSGLYRPELAAPNNQGNPYCFIDGGKFDIMAGAGYEKVSGDVTFKINHSKIGEFYGGGINGSNPIGGKIDVTIDNSMVDKYCGGPKVGDMSGKTVTTHATGTTFGVFYGGGNGGNSYYRQLQRDGDMASTHIGTWNNQQYNWDGFTPLETNYDDGSEDPINDQEANKTRKIYNKGYHAEYEFEVFNQSNGVTDQITQRGFIKWIQFGITKTGNVQNTLSDCKILSNFYGGGNLATVDGTVTSTLTNTQVTGSVFGAGFSAAIPTFQVHDKANAVFPSLDKAGTVIDGSVPYASTVYEWTNDLDGVEGHDDDYMKEHPTYSKEVNGETKWYCYTWNSLADLGTVTGNVSLTIDGNTEPKDGKVMSVDKSVYGGGEESAVGGDTEVKVSGGTIGVANAPAYGALVGNVYGGGKGTDDDVLAGLVKGNTKVEISDGRIYHNVYGGGAYGSVGDFIYDTTTGLPTGRKENTSGGKCTVTVTGGTIGTNGKENGMVFGSSRGDVGKPGDITDKLAWVYETDVTIGTSGSNAGPLVKGSVYGGGENGHNLNNAKVTVYSGTVGIASGEKITMGGKDYVGARYPYRGNVYGGGCGTDVYYTSDKEGTTTVNENYNGTKYTWYNFNAGIVKGNTTINMTGGHVVHNVYGAGAMGSVGSFTFNAAGKPSGLSSGGKCTITVSGGEIGASGMSMSAAGGPDDYGYIFGAGRGDVLNPDVYPNVEVVGYVYDTDVTVSGTAFVRGAVYGGAESGHVLHDTKVKIMGDCQIGCGNGESGKYTDWTATSLKPCNSWPYEENGYAYDPYAESNGYYADGVTSAEGGRPSATDGHTFYGNVFGGGSGYYPYAPGKWLRSAGIVEGSTVIDIQGGHILSNVYGGCEMADVLGSVTITMSGGTVGVPRSQGEILNNPTLCHLFGAGKGDKRIFFNTSTNVASTDITITGGTVYGSVYGGGEDGHVLGKAKTTISQAENKTTLIGSRRTESETRESGYDGNVFGGGQGSISAKTAGVVGGNVELNIQGGEMLGSVYGGGRIASVGTYFAMATNEDGTPNANYGKMQAGNDHGCITVTMTGGKISQNVYGGCMGTVDDEDYGVSKNVIVNLNKDVADDAKGCIVLGSIYGCNNVNSSPQGSVTVNVYGTQNADKSQIANTDGESPVTDAKRKGYYDVHAVYGGGNLAAFKPTDAYSDDETKKAAAHTIVNINGCERISIEQVYGGGNAASTPATEVNVTGTFEVNELFGGGNGADKILKDGVLVDNPGANVGYKAYSVDYDPPKSSKTERETKFAYGSGKAAVNIHGGTIHSVFGGSNTKGNVRESAVTMLEDADACTFCVDAAYGGGKSAPMDAEAVLHMACIPGLKVAYGGAEAADILGDVKLNITNGTFDRVFGGNNMSGTINGSITINIEETGCKPIIIGELYGGGNQAGYSIYGYKYDDKLEKMVPIENSSDKDALKTPYNNPVVNIKSFTSIGEVYGGGYGTGAVMVGSPTVNVNEALGDKASDDAAVIGVDKAVKNGEIVGKDQNGSYPEGSYPIPSHASGKIGAINNVYGGGNAAKVIGSTTVKIGTEATITYETKEDDLETTDKNENQPAVVGADIRGNVYGGGNAAEVTGDTKVIIGKEDDAPATP